MTEFICYLYLCIIKKKEADFPSGNSLVAVPKIIPNRSLEKSDLNVFFTDELETLIKIKKKFEYWDSTEISELSHKEKAWIETGENDPRVFSRVLDLRSANCRILISFEFADNEESIFKSAANILISVRAKLLLSSLFPLL